jgi:tRNA(Ile2) C34 agmatinyltransferase TiaS
MIYVGLDDTDTLDDPGTNQLARHIVRELASMFNGRMILRHQLLEDPRVPCTKKNGCASILFEPVGWAPPRHSGNSTDKRWAMPPLLIEKLRDLILAWSPAGSDPGFCVTSHVPQEVIDWGMRAKREIVTQQEARTIAAANHIHLEGLGGTEDGVIGALAAIGLMATKNDGRVVYFGASNDDWYDVTGCLDVKQILARGVDEILTADTNESLESGTVEVGKRLRPNFRNGRVVLYVARGESPQWEAVRIT